MNQLNHQVIKATKWSSITEIAAKLVAPISTMVLARVLTPEAFGVLVTATMVISFAEIFTDAGFQKYIVQHEFDSKKSLYQSTNVAFLSNLIMSLAILAVIIIFADDIAEVVGNKGYGLVISISSICIPLAAFSSIQMALYKRQFDFKTLFLVRMVGVAIPLVITIPLALIFKSYWALIGGMIALNLSNAIILTCKSKWKPRLWYKWGLFEEMFSFTFWSMMEAVAIWLTSYIDIFIVGRMLNEYYLGLYRTSMSTVGQFIGIVTAATTPVLFSSLSRLQNADIEFKKMFFKFQKLVGLLVIPLGVGIFIFRDLITEFLLGSQWHEASYFIGLWALTGAITIVLSHYASEVYRAKGRPLLSVLSQITHIAFLIPTVLISIRYGYDCLCEWRSIIRLQLIITNMIILYYLVRYTPLSMIKNIMPSLLAAAGMWAFSYLLPESDTYFVEFLYIIPCIIIYLLIICCFPIERHILFNLKTLLRRG